MPLLFHGTSSQVAFLHIPTREGRVAAASKRGGGGEEMQKPMSLTLFGLT